MVQREMAQKLISHKVKNLSGWTYTLSVSVTVKTFGKRFKILSSVVIHLY